MEVTKLKYDPWGRKFMIHQADDREKDFNNKPFDYRVRPKKSTKPKPKAGTIEYDMMEKNATLVSRSDDRLPQIHTKQSQFSGLPTLDSKKDLYEYNLHARYLDRLPGELTPEKPKEFAIRMPHVPDHCKESLGKDFIELLWQEFCNHGVNKFGLIQFKHIPEIRSSMSSAFGESIPLDVEDDVDQDDTVLFDDLLNKLGVHFSRKGCRPVYNPPEIALPPCCANYACAFHLGKSTSAVNPQAHNEENYVIDVVYKRYVNIRKGNVRLKDLPLILSEANVSFDSSKICDKDWFLHGEMLLSLEEFERLTEIIRTDVEEPENEDERLYRVPDWLKNEFTQQELDMFRNQFMIIDVDKGGAIDAEELQELTESLGNRLSYEEALELIADFDLDRSGTIDFGEFLTLMFKIKAGTIDAADNKLVTAILESKNQIKIFSEIEEIKHNPPKYIGVVGYGGVPVLCDFVIQGPKGSAYENGYFGFRVTFEHGYPYKTPTVLFTSRIISVNVMQLVDGTGLLMHFSEMWDSKWNIRRLLNHIIDILLIPDFSLIPQNMMYILNLWLKDKGHEEIHPDPSPLLVSEKDRPPTPPPDVAEAMAEAKRLREEAAKQRGDGGGEKLPNLISMDELKTNVRIAQEGIDKANKAMDKANKSGKKKKINAAKKVLDAAIAAKDDAEFALKEGEEEERNAAEAQQAEEDAYMLKQGKSKMHANPTYEEFMKRLPRVEQMHLNVLTIYLLDKERYKKAIRQMTELFCLKNPIEHMGCLIGYGDDEDFEVPVDQEDVNGLLKDETSLVNSVDMSELENPSTLLEPNADHASLLPHPWERIVNEANDEFYYNPITGEAIWERPVA